MPRGWGLHASCTVKYRSEVEGEAADARVGARRGDALGRRSRRGV